MASPHLTSKACFLIIIFSPSFQLIVLSGHIAAAVMVFLARRETTISGDPTGCWLGAGSFGGSPNWQEWPILKKYVVTIYWSVMTLTSIGYGDLLPVTVLERAFVALYGVWSMGLVSCHLLVWRIAYNPQNFCRLLRSLQVLAFLCLQSRSGTTFIG